MKWSVADSIKLFNIENWGNRFFNINENGNLSVHPSKNINSGIDITKVIEEVKLSGLQFPILLRFQDIIRQRVVELNETFRRVIEEAKYKGEYRGVYPIKVNQLREVVEEIIDAGKPYAYGLEAGSKAELVAILAMETNPGSLVICNGYKDYEFIKLALMGKLLGKNVLIVIEKISDLYEILTVAKELGVDPQIGIRCKLSTRGSGKWEGSGGELAKFGLTTPELLHAVEILKREGKEHCFKLVHFHIGSQVTNIRTIKDAVKETTRIYSKLIQMGMPLEYIDVGGGLGVDYDGSRTDFSSSTNYSLEEYVSDVVYAIQEICAAEDVPEPHIVSESGRAIVAHHSVLLVNVFGNIEVGTTPILLNQNDEESDVVKEMRYIEQNISHKNLLENYHDAVQRKEEALSMFKLGILSLEDRAKVEHAFWVISKKIYKLSRDMKYIPDEINELKEQLADQYLCNFSVFQSMLDHWAIEHLFPIMPIHRLNEKPLKETTLVDITCDSDGKINKFIDLRDIKNTLPLHHLIEEKDYVLGIFLMGAYQDIMGDLHNLFGRVNEAHVFLDESEPDGYYVEEVIQGHKISNVLDWIQYSPSYLEKSLKLQIDDNVRRGQLKPKQGVDFQNFYEKVLHGYTYINIDPLVSVSNKNNLLGTFPSGDEASSPVL